MVDAYSTRAEWDQYHEERKAEIQDRINNIKATAHAFLETCGIEFDKPHFLALAIEALNEIPCNQCEARYLNEKIIKPIAEMLREEVASEIDGAKKKDRPAVTEPALVTKHEAAA